MLKKSEVIAFMVHVTDHLYSHANRITIRVLSIFVIASVLSVAVYQKSSATALLSDKSTNIFINTNFVRYQDQYCDQRFLDEMRLMHGRPLPTGNGEIALSVG